MSAPAVWLPLDLVRWTEGYFKRHGVPAARLDAEILLSHVLGLDRMGLYLSFEQAVREDHLARFREFVKRRALDRVPVAYLTGVREFWSLEIKVTPDVLIPRPETEVLVEAVLALQPARIAEIGTGSGAVSAALARELPDASIVAVERSPAALAVAVLNLQTLGLSDRVQLGSGDGLSGLAPGFDLIVSNPPYVRSADLAGLAPELQHEPREALDGGPDGLDLIEALCREASGYLVDGGHLALEGGAGQAAVISERMRQAGAAEIAISRDLAGVERVVIGQFNRG